MVELAAFPPRPPLGLGSRMGLQEGSPGVCVLFTEEVDHVPLDVAVE
ncbi:hypothetical protein [Spirillospora sp. CA-128828]